MFRLNNGEALGFSYILNYNFNYYLFLSFQFMLYSTLVYEEASSGERRMTYNSSTPYMVYILICANGMDVKLILIRFDGRLSQLTIRKDHIRYY